MKQRISCLVGALALAATLLSGCGAQPGQSALATNPSDTGRPVASQARQLGVSRAGQSEAQESSLLSDWWRRAYAKLQADAAAGDVQRVLGQQPAAR